ncbi:MAG: NAD(P)H-hydrate dehydratase [Alphaproteobacteria bacterium]
MEILTAAQMYGADKETCAKIMPEIQLMENAGFAAACALSRHFGKQPVTVLCGSGNNGGDGFVMARVLHGWGWPVEVVFAGDMRSMTESTRFNARRWEGETFPLSGSTIDRIRKRKAIVVDALFGIGLSRPLEAPVARQINALNEAGIPCVALDIPSGIQADTGKIMGTALRCVLTLTFARPKIGHFLYPGREYAATTEVLPIGIPDEIVIHQDPCLFVNGPDLFHIPAPSPYDHKYTRGAVLIAGGRMTGAARLAAAGARRAGAGWVKIVCPPETSALYAAGAPGIIVEAAETSEAFAAAANDPKIRAAVIGMGSGVTPETEKRLEAVVRSEKPFVADADALAFITGRDMTHGVLTPHEGEFARFFPGIEGRDKLSRALAAARETGGVIVLKGADTVIAAPDGRAAIDAETSFGLATAGSGDVLSGIIGAGLARGLPLFEAACAGVWMHSQAGILAGKNLIAEDIAEALPFVGTDG